MSWVDIQEKAFTRWVNEELKDRGMHITSLKEDFKDGLKLIHLLEIISGKSVGRYNKHPRIPSQKLENTAIAMKFIKDEGIKLVNISNDDITEGRLKLILGLIWTLILRYQINKKGGTDAKSELLKWVRSKIPEYDVKNFTTDWNDGRALNALIDALKPGTCPNHKKMDPSKKVDNLRNGINKGYSTFGIPMILEPEEMADPKIDEQSVMTYISYYRDLPPQQDDASKCRAYGPGLEEGIVGQAAPFVVEVPEGCNGKLEVKVEGPNSKAKVQVTKKPDGNYDVQYHPTEPGEYKIHVTLDGKHIPGSIFHVTVLQEESLGGEGKILVFYTTTSAKSEQLRPMQELLERKKIHLRPDFEPWIPVDIMTPKDRDTVFRKAGTKNLPIVYIDDVYIGDYQRILELEKSGELDKLLKYDSKTGKSGNKDLVQAKPSTTPAPKPQPTQSKPTSASVKVDVSADTKEAKPVPKKLNTTNLPFK